MADAPQKQIRMRIQENNVRATYANAFRHNTNASPTELILDFGINTVVNHPDAKGTAEDPSADMLFQVDSRVVMNYTTTKRLAGFLNQLVAAHEKQFGPIPADGQQG